MAMVASFGVRMATPERRPVEAPHWPLFVLCPQEPREGLLEYTFYPLPAIRSKTFSDANSWAITGPHSS
jgi:hypothetical protein